VVCGGIGVRDRGASPVIAAFRDRCDERKAADPTTWSRLDVS
jgi:hypothetical protein